jgi:hypothetical protein
VPAVQRLEPIHAACGIGGGGHVRRAIEVARIVSLIRMNLIIIALAGIYVHFSAFQTE